MGNYKRGEIYYIASKQDEEGTEQKGNRPAVIVSNDVNNVHSTAIEIVYMTTKPKVELPTHFVTYETGKRSTVLCEQVNTVYAERIDKKIGCLREEEIEKLDHCLRVSLQISIENELKKIIKERDFYKEMYEHLAEKAMQA